MVTALVTLMNQYLTTINHHGYPVFIINPPFVHHCASKTVGHYQPNRLLCPAIYEPSTHHQVNHQLTIKSTIHSSSIKPFGMSESIMNDGELITLNSPSRPSNHRQWSLTGINGELLTMFNPCMNGELL